MRRGGPKAHGGLCYLCSCSSAGASIRRADDGSAGVAAPGEENRLTPTIESLGRPASGRLRHGDRGQGPGDRRRMALMSTLIATGWKPMKPLLLHQLVRAQPAGDPVARGDAGRSEEGSRSLPLWLVCDGAALN